MVSLLVPVTLLAEFLAAVAVAFSVALPRRRIWPPSHAESWQSWTMGALFVLSGAGVVAVGILDWGSWGLPAPVRWAVGAPLCLAGNALATWGAATLGYDRTFGGAGTLARRGPYRYTRNPQYLGFIAGLIGWALFSGAALALPVALAGAVACALAPLAEEPWLAERYGAQYEAYRRSVPRYLGPAARTRGPGVQERTRGTKGLPAPAPQAETASLPSPAARKPAVLPSPPPAAEEDAAKPSYNLPREMRTVELARREGDAADYVSATIDDDGALRVMRNSFGPNDYETEVTAIVFAKDLDRLLEMLLREVSRPQLPEGTSREERDRIILRLIKQLWEGDRGAVEAFAAFARVRGIEVGWFRWP